MSRTLADYEGDAWFPGTPKGRNFFYTMYRWGQDDRRSEWRSWQLPTAANPHIKPTEIEAMRREMPERSFAQEILATFLEDGGGVFRRVRAQATAAAQSSRHHAHTYVFGVDWARSNDYTVISVIDATTKELCYLDRFTQIDYDREMALIATRTADGVERQVGSARYTLAPDGEAVEFALVVADDWQKCGLGRRLMGALIDCAQSDPDNADALLDLSMVLELAQSL